MNKGDPQLSRGRNDEHGPERYRNGDGAVSTPEPQACETPLEDLRRSALRHYDEISTVAHVWLSVIPKAINFYFDRQVSQVAGPASESDSEGETWTRV